MNIDKLREAWQLGNPKVFRFKSIFGFIQFCWENKFTPYNSAEAKKAAEKGIKFDTLTIGDNQWYKKLSKMTNGVSAPFSTSSKTSQLVEAAALARGGEVRKMVLLV